jgi:hypothetical protein
MATAPAAEAFSRRLGAAVRGLSGAWYGRHLAAAERAIRARIPLVDLVLEVRDARVRFACRHRPHFAPRLSDEKVLCTPTKLTGS